MNVFFNLNSNRLAEYFKNLFTKRGIKNLIFGSSTSKKMFRIYFLILIIFAVLLYLPISIEPFQREGFGGPVSNLQYINNHYVMTIHLFDGESWVPQPVEFKFNFFDCLFTAFSAFSDTGLTLAPTTQVFSTFGKIILLLLIQIGGFGIMFFLFLVWRIFNKMDKVSIGQTLLAQSEKGNTKIGDTQKMLITSSIFILVLEFCFGLFFSLWFLYMPAYEQYIPPDSNGFTLCSDINNHLYKNPNNAFFAGFFHSVSAVNNAGFDIIGDNSLAAYRNGANTIFLMATAFLFILGGIGFPIVYDIMQKIDVTKHDWFKYKKINFKFLKFKINKRHHLSLLTKVVLSSYFGIMFFSIFLSFIFECTNAGAGINYLWNDNTGAFGPVDNQSLCYYNKSVNIIFQALSTRSAGFSTFNNQLLNPSTKWLNICLMYIGGAPSSTAGGIRVTTLSIMFISIWRRLLGSNNIAVFRRSIAQRQINDAFIISFIAIVILLIGSIIIAADITKGIDELDSFTNAIFISTSAFGTTGLSSIDLTELNWCSKLYLMILMFIGQYSISSTILAFRRNKVIINTFQYITEDIKF